MPACRTPAQPRSSSASWPRSPSAGGGLRRPRTPRGAGGRAARDVHLRRRRPRAPPAAPAATRPGAAASPGARPARGGAHGRRCTADLVEAGQFARRRRAAARAGGSGRGARCGALTASTSARLASTRRRTRARWCSRRACACAPGDGRPLPDGLAILFFTLGRVGDARGGMADHSRRHQPVTLPKGVRMSRRHWAHLVRPRWLSAAAALRPRRRRRPAGGDGRRRGGRPAATADRLPAGEGSGDHGDRPRGCRSRPASSPAASWPHRGRGGRRRGAPGRGSSGARWTTATCRSTS